ncbi:5330_t:CDS:2, partial [Gigaspora margarita]
QSLRIMKDYKTYKAEINEGTWQMDAISIPLKYSLRSITDAMLIMPEKSSQALSARKNSKSSSSESDKENKSIEKKKEKERMKIQPQKYFKKKKIGKKPDFSIVSKASYFKKKLELLVGEVSNSPWKEKNDKTNRGFKMKILCLDKPRFCLYRVKKVDEITIPVKIEDNSINKVFEKLM